MNEYQKFIDRYQLWNKGTKLVFSDSPATFFSTFLHSSKKSISVEDMNGKVHTKAIRSIVKVDGKDVVFGEIPPKKTGSIVDDGEGSSTGTGSLYEFFTPEVVSKKMWDFAYQYGFHKEGRVLEPAAGNGRLIKYAPIKANVTAFEINPDNVASIKNQYPEVKVYTQGFETAFLEAPRFNTRIKSKLKPSWLLDNGGFDLVIANPPYGKFTGFYASFFNYKTQFEHWFIEYTMNLLNIGGIGVYLIPSSFLRNGNTYTTVKERLFEKCQLLDAYRLPANIFAKTQIGTDIVVLKRIHK